jgi:hypothetical protein
VNSLPSLPMAAAWYGPHDTCDTLQGEQHTNKQEAQKHSEQQLQCQHQHQSATDLPPCIFNTLRTL